MIASGAHEELLRFAETARIPVITTFMGIGGFPSGHPLHLGMPGMHGTYAANMAICHCDLLIGIGARFDDRVTMGRLDAFAPHAKIVHIDIDPAEIGKNVETYIPIVGDVKRTLAAALEGLAPADSAAWLAQLDDWKRAYPLRYQMSGDRLKPQYVIELLDELTGGEAIITTDVGQHQMWVAQFYRFKRPRSLISSGGLGAMGFGFPAAIGAKLGCPDKPVIAVVGDGGFQMTMQELAVVKQYRIPVKVVIINNRCLGMVRQWQELFYRKRYSEVDLSVSPDYVKLAEAYGLRGLRAETPEEARAVLKEALELEEPVVVDCVVEPEENVYPMVAPGKRLDEMVLGDEA